MHQIKVLLFESVYDLILCTIVAPAMTEQMNILQCPKNDMEQFWDIVQSPVHLILQTLGE